MSCTLFPRVNRRKLVKLSALSSKVRKGRPPKKQRKANASSVKQPQYILTSHRRLMTEQVKPNATNKGCYCNEDFRLRHSTNEIQSSIESILLSRQHQLFAPNHSENARRQCIKKAALEIAADLGVPRKTFKATKKWLDTFVKRYKLLGHSVSLNAEKFQEQPSVLKNASQKKEGPKEASTKICNQTCSFQEVPFGDPELYNLLGSSDINKPQAHIEDVHSQNSCTLSQVPVDPELFNLFGSYDDTESECIVKDVQSETSHPLSDVSIDDPELYNLFGSSNIPEVQIPVEDFRSQDDQPISQERGSKAKNSITPTKRPPQNVSNSLRYNALLRKILSHKDVHNYESDGWLPEKCFHSGKTECKLQVVNEAEVQHSDQQFTPKISDDVYDDLFMFSQAYDAMSSCVPYELMDCRPSLPALDDCDSGYRSRSESQNTEAPDEPSATVAMKRDTLSHLSAHSNVEVHRKSSLPVQDYHLPNRLNSQSCPNSNHSTSGDNCSKPQHPSFEPKCTDLTSQPSKFIPVTNDDDLLMDLFNVAPSEDGGAFAKASVIANAAENELDLSNANFEPFDANCDAESWAQTYSLTEEDDDWVNALFS